MSHHGDAEHGHWSSGRAALTTDPFLQSLIACALMRQQRLSSTLAVSSYRLLRVCVKTRRKAGFCFLHGAGRRSSFEKTQQVYKMHKYTVFSFFEKGIQCFNFSPNSSSTPFLSLSPSQPQVSSLSKSLRPLSVGHVHGYGTIHSPLLPQQPVRASE